MVTGSDVRAGNEDGDSSETKGVAGRDRCANVPEASARKGADVIINAVIGQPGRAAELLYCLGP